MSIRNIISTGMGRMLLIALTFSLIFPVCLFIYDLIIINKLKGIKVTVVLLYIGGMVYLTLLDRRVGENNHINLTLFWSYAKFGIAQYRWQIYLNILLFFPLGTLLSWSFNLSFVKTVIIGIMLSVLFEGIQYFLRLGMCELDDILHNSLGTALGYIYWKHIKPWGYKITGCDEDLLG